MVSMVKIRLNVALIVGLFVITAAMYSRAAYFPFCVIDDNDYVTKNLHVMSGLSAESISWAFTTFHASNWHPVTWLSLMLDSQLFGVDPVGFHLVNVALHALNTSLLFLLLSSMTGAVWRSAFVSACFALHPLHVESVAWIAERKDVLSTLFLMLTLLFYSSYVRRPRRGMYVLSLAMFALGLMAKPMLVTIPVILLLLDFWPLERINMRLFCTTGPRSKQEDNNYGFRQLKSMLLEKIPFALLATGSSIVTIYAQKSSISTITDVPLLMRVTNALWSSVMYVEKMFFPFGLSILYPFVSVPLWEAGGAAVILCGISIVVLKYTDRHPYLAAGWFWYLITLLPVIGVIKVGMQSMADRYTYIPFIGLFIMAGWGGAELCTIAPKLRNLIGTAVVGAVLFYSIITWVQLGYWRDNMTLINHSLEVTEDNSFLHSSLAMLYGWEGKPELAMNEYRESIRIDPSYAEAHLGLAVCLENSGKIEEAINEHQKAVKIDPDNAQYHNNLGISLARQGVIDEAIEHLSIAVHLKPDDEKARHNLEKALQMKSKISGK
jgi:protein O-mannosyl-transferase